MSEGNKPVGERQSDGNDEGQTVQELKAQLELEKSRSQRLLDESKSYKLRASKAETTLSDMDKQQLEADGKLQERLSKEIQENESLKGLLNSRTEMVLSKELKAEAARFAKDAHDVDTLLKASPHRDLLQIDEDKLSVAGVEEFVKKTRETHPYLFSKSSLPDTENKKPVTNSSMNPQDNNQAYLTELKAAKSQRELDAVFKKYGRANHAYTQG